MSLYNITATVEAQDISEAWDRITQIPSNFAPNADWAGFSEFEITSVDSGKSISLSREATK